MDSQREARAIEGGRLILEVSSYGGAGFRLHVFFGIELNAQLLYRYFEEPCLIGTPCQRGEDPSSCRVG